MAGIEASTLHRLLQLRPGGEAVYNRDNPLDADLVVVDEASMLDVLLANTLVKAIPPGAHLLFVGDVNQLPSVGAGEVLRDLRDEGIGIPAADLAPIFDRFARAGNVVGPFQGTGIGLASARGIVEQHGGSIAMESTEGVGPTFTVRLPLADSAVDMTSGRTIVYP